VTLVERTAILKLAGVAESIVVQGSGSRIDARSSGFATRFESEALKAIPVRRFSMFDFIRAAPGVSPTSPTSAANSGVSALGSGVNENLFLLDGTNFTCPCSGGAIAEPAVDIIQEVQVQSIGASAEFGNIQGAVFNVITRQGGNRFLDDASYYGQTASLTSQPVLLPVAAASQSVTAYERIRYRDFTTNVAVQANAIGFGSSRDTSTCAITTVSLAQTAGSRGRTSRTRSLASSRGSSSRACNCCKACTTSSGSTLSPQSL
jgi:hypothetical protein